MGIALIAMSGIRACGPRHEVQYFEVADLNAPTALPTGLPLPAPLAGTGLRPGANLGNALPSG